MSPSQQLVITNRIISANATDKTTRFIAVETNCLIGFSYIFID